MTETQAYEILRAAQLHEHLGEMASSAKLCAQDAEALFNRGDYGYAYKRALRSLAYSLGMFHPTYQKFLACPAH